MYKDLVNRLVDESKQVHEKSLDTNKVTRAASHLSTTKRVIEVSDEPIYVREEKPSTSKKKSRIPIVKKPTKRNVRYPTKVVQFDKEIPWL
jgi:hypothetical protein